MDPISPQGREARWMGSMSQRVALLALTTRNVSTAKENLAHTILTHFATRLDSLAFLLKEMQIDAGVCSGDYGRLERGSKIADEVLAMETFLDSFAEKSNLYLLSSCPDISKNIQISSKRLREALDSVLEKAGTTAMKLRIAQVKEAFATGSPKLDAKQQAVLDSLEPEMLDSIVSDPARITKLVQLIAESLEMRVGSEDFEREVEKLKKDKEAVENRKGKAYTLFLDQIVSVLEKGMATKFKPIGVPQAEKPLLRDVPMRSTPFSPLQSFICPITRDVMRDPVQIASGQTYERGAIDRWFSEGHTRCPMGEELKNTKMKSNLALRQSIAEWRERNYDIRIQNAGEKLFSDSAEEQESAVLELQHICEEDSMNKYAITSKGLLVPMIRLAEKQKFELRKTTFAALRTLADDNEENQDIMVSEGVVDMMVRCLARYDESESAVVLLRLLSAKPSSAEKISRAHGAVLLLVTLLGSEREETAANAKAILENLPTSDENIVMMAEANLMNPLVTRLIDGSFQSRVTMAKTLAHLQMPDSSKIQAATEESIGKLLEMSQSHNDEEKEAAVGALENLSNVRHVCILMTTAEPSGQEILMPLITSTKTSSNVKVVASRVIANIMTSLARKWEPVAIKNEQVEWLVCAFLQLLNPFAASAVHAQLLQGLLGVANGVDSGKSARLLMKDREAFSLLIPFVKNEMDPEVKKNAFKVFASLSIAYGAEAAAALKENSQSMANVVEVLLRDSHTSTEQIAAVTILANLPVDDTFVTKELLQRNCVPLLVKFLGSKSSKMQEAAAGALLRFTAPSSKDTQLRLAADGVIQRYVGLLDSMSGLAKERAATALANFSRSSASLSRPVAPLGCFQCFATQMAVCDVHGGECKVESSFCLKEADAVTPLLAVVKESESKSREAAIAALLTLVDDSLDSHEPGCHLIAKAKGVPTIIDVLNISTPKAQQDAIFILERIFRVQQYRQQYGLKAQMQVITVAQKGANSKSKHIAGMLLRQLDLIHSQSTYFPSQVA